MKRMSYLLALPIIVGAAQAALVSQDSVYGPDTVTLDTDTGLLWLDWSLSVGQSFEQVAMELGDGGTFSGFRFATNAEVAQLWENAGVVDLTTEGPIEFASDFTRDNFVPAVSLITLLGATGANGNLAEGLTADEGNAPGTQTVAELQLCTGGPCVALGAPRNSALASLGPNDQAGDVGSSIIGAALVRDTVAVVPLPGALWLGLSGLLVLLPGARRAVR